MQGVMKPRICQWSFTISFVLIDIKISSKIKISDQWILLFLHTIKFLGFEEAKIPLKGCPIQPINAPHLYTPEEEKRAIHMCTGMHSCSCGCTIWVCLKTYPKIFQIDWDILQHKKIFIHLFSKYVWPGHQVNQKQKYPYVFGVKLFHCGTKSISKMPY